MFQRQCYLTTSYDAVKLNARHIGTDHILWSSNFPAANSTWPDSQRYVERGFAGMTDIDKQKILWSNTSKLYRIEGELK
jgi:predicted TIM-barrel fold metal-dependent hydrolase